MRRFDALLADHIQAFEARGLISARWSDYTAALAGGSSPPKSRYLLCIRDMRGKFVKLSGSWETNLGYRAAELHGAQLLSLVHPADTWETHDRMEAVRGGRADGGFTNRYRCSYGGFRQFEWTARLFGDHVFGIAHDVTDLIGSAQS